MKGFVILVGILISLKISTQKPSELKQGAPQITVNNPPLISIHWVDIKEQLNSQWFAALLSGLIAVWGTVKGVKIANKRDDERRKEDKGEAEVKALQKIKADAAKLIPEIKHCAYQALRANACGNYLVSG